MRSMLFALAVVVCGGYCPGQVAENEYADNVRVVKVPGLVFKIAHRGGLVESDFDLIVPKDDPSGESGDQSVTYHLALSDWTGIERPYLQEWVGKSVAVTGLLIRDRRSNYLIVHRVDYEEISQ